MNHINNIDTISIIKQSARKILTIVHGQKNYTTIPHVYITGNLSHLNNEHE